MQGGWQPPPGSYGPPGGGYGAPPGYSGAPPPMGVPPNPYAHGYPMPPQYGDYEFNPYENAILDKTAGRAKLWGTISTIIGIGQIIGSCGMLSNPVLATYLPAGIVAIVVGITFIGAGNSLKAVVTTQGNDLMHLMQAMQKLSTAFVIEIVCSVVAFVLAVIGIVLFLFVFVAVAASR